MRVTRINTSPIFTLPGNDFSCNPAIDKLQENPPHEYVGWDKSKELSDIPAKSCSEVETKNNITKHDECNHHRDLLIDLFENFNISLYDNAINKLTTLGYTEQESTEILKRLIESKERSADWSINAVRNCGIGAKAILLSFPFAVVKSLINNFEIELPPLLTRSIGFLDGLFTGIRNFFQNMIYGGRPDDDRVRNNYEAKRYGNTISSVQGDIAFHTETKVNPWAFPLLELLSDKTREIVKPTIFSQNPMWFRVRMGSDINLRFATDFLSFLIHKPLSLLGFKKSKEKVNEINQRGFLSKNYVKKRCAENIGLDNGESNSIKNIFSRLFKSFKVLFSNKSDLKTKKRISDKIGKLLGPFLGLYGYLALAISLPIKAVLKYFDKENRFLDSFFQSGFASQHLEYIFKFVLPEEYDNKPQGSSSKNSKLVRLQSDRNKLFKAGLGIFLVNIILVPLKLFKFENRYIKFFREVCDVIADKGVAYYFSTRRELKGKDHKLFNEELYNEDGTVKIISDKLPSLDEIEKVPEDLVDPKLKTETRQDGKTTFVVKHLKPAGEHS